MAWSCSSPAGGVMGPTTVSPAATRSRLLVRARVDGTMQHSASTPPDQLLLHPRPATTHTQQQLTDVAGWVPIRPALSASSGVHHLDPGLQPLSRPTLPGLLGAATVQPGTAFQSQGHHMYMLAEKLELMLEEHQVLARTGSLPQHAADLLLSGAEVDIQQLQEALEPLSLVGHAVMLTACAQSDLKLTDQMMATWGKALLPCFVRALSQPTLPFQGQPGDVEMTGWQLRASGANAGAGPAALRLAHHLAALLTITTALGRMNKHLGIDAMAALMLCIQPHLHVMPVPQLVGLAEALALMGYFPYTPPADRVVEAASAGLSTGSTTSCPDPSAAALSHQPHGSVPAADQQVGSPTVQHDQPPWMQQFLQVVLQRVNQFTGPQICAVLRSVARLSYHPWSTHKSYRHVEQQLVAAVTERDEWQADVLEMLAKPRRYEGRAGGGYQLVDADRECQWLYPHEMQVSLWALNHFNLPVKGPWLQLLLASCGRHAVHLTPKALSSAFKIMATYRATPPHHVQLQLWRAVMHRWRYVSSNRMYAMMWHAQQAGLTPPSHVAALVLKAQVQLARRHMMTACKPAATTAAAGSAPEVEGPPLDVRRLVHLLYVAGKSGLHLQADDALPLTWAVCQWLPQAGSCQLIAQGMYSLAVCCPGLAASSQVAATAPTLGAAAAEGSHVRARQPAVHVLAGQMLRAACDSCLPVMLQDATPGQCARLLWAFTALGVAPTAGQTLELLARACCVRPAGHTRRQSDAHEGNGGMSANDAVLLLVAVGDIGMAALLGSMPRQPSLHQQTSSSVAHHHLPAIDALDGIVRTVETVPPQAVLRWQSGLLPRYLAAVTKLRLLQHVTPQWWGRACLLLNAQLTSLPTAHLVLLLQAACSTRSQPGFEHSQHKAPEQAHTAHQVLAESPQATQTDEHTATSEPVPDSSASQAFLEPRVICSALSARDDLVQLPAPDMVYVVWNCAQSRVHLSSAAVQQITQVLHTGILQLGPSHLSLSLLGLALHELHWTPSLAPSDASPATAAPVPDADAAATSAVAGEPGLRTRTRPSKLIKAVLAIPAAKMLAACSPHHNWGADYEQQRYTGSWPGSSHTSARHVTELVCAMTPNQLSTLLLGLAYWLYWDGSGFDAAWLEAYMALIKSRSAGVINWLGVSRLVAALLVVHTCPSKSTVNYLSRQVKGLRKGGHISIQEDIEMRQMMHQLLARVQQERAGAAVVAQAEPAHLPSSPAQQVAGMVMYGAQGRAEQLAQAGHQVAPSPVHAAYHMASQLLRSFYLQQLYRALDVLSRTLGGQADLAPPQSSEHQQGRDGRWQQAGSVADWALALLQESLPGSKESIATSLLPAETREPSRQSTLLSTATSSPSTASSQQVPMQERAQVVEEVHLDVAPPSETARPTHSSAVIKQLYDQMTLTLFKLASAKGIAKAARVGQPPVLR